MYFNRLITFTMLLFLLFVYDVNSASIIENTVAIDTQIESDESEVSSKQPASFNDVDFQGIAEKDPKTSRNALSVKDNKFFLNIKSKSSIDLINPVVDDTKSESTENDAKTSQDVSRAIAYEFFFNIEREASIDLINPSADQEEDVLNYLTKQLYATDHKDHIVDTLIVTDLWEEILNGQTIRLFFVSELGEHYNGVKNFLFGLKQLFNTTSAVRAVLFPVQFQYLSSREQSTLSANEMLKTDSKKEVVIKEKKRLIPLDWPTDSISTVPLIILSVLIFFVVIVMLKNLLSKI